MRITFRSEIISLRSECDKLTLEARFAREKHEGVMKDAEHQVIESLYIMIFIVCVCWIYS